MRYYIGRTPSSDGMFIQKDKTMSVKKINKCRTNCKAEINGLVGRPTRSESEIRQIVNFKRKLRLIDYSDIPRTELSDWLANN